MTTISLVANDQLLSIALQPLVASGDHNSVALHVDFDDAWAKCGKTAVFFTESNSTVYEVALVDGDCIIPYEVLTKAGTLYIGVRGYDATNNAVKTSSLVKYKITQGAPSGTGTAVDPSPDVYQQLVSLSNETRSIAQKASSFAFSMMGVDIEQPYTKEIFDFDYFVVLDNALGGNLILSKTEETTSDGVITSVAVGHKVSYTEGSPPIITTYVLTCSNNGGTNDEDWDVSFAKIDFSGSRSEIDLTATQADGTPQYKVIGYKYTVGAMSSVADTDLDMNHKSIVNVNSIEFDFGQGLSVTGGIYHSNGARLHFASNVGNKRVGLSNIADGVDDTDAVNVGQLNSAVGDIETALDSIIAIQESLIGGASV